MARRGKKLSIDGTVPGVQFNLFHPGYSQHLSDGHTPIDLPHPQQHYEPHLGRMDIFDPDYTGYEWQPRPLQSSPLRMGPVEQAPAPAMSLYERDAQLFAILDQMEQDMRESSFRRLPGDCGAIVPSGPSENWPNLREHDDPVDKISLILSMNRQANDHSDPPLDAMAELEQLISAPSEPELCIGSPCELEEQMLSMDQQMAIEPPRPTEFDQAQQIFDEQMAWFRGSLDPFGMGPT